MSKITLPSIGSIQQNPTTAATTINSNFATIQTAMDNTLSRDGTAPDQMTNNLDMNSQQILNLPAPGTANSPLRLSDLEQFQSTGTISLLPPGGTTGQVLAKHSNNNYDVNWGNAVSSVGLSLPSDFTVTGSPVTASGTLTGSWVTTPTGTGSVVRSNTPTLVSPLLGTPTSGVLTNCTGTAAGLTAGNVTTNANLTGPITSTGNATAIAAQTGTGTTFVMQTSPSLTTPALGTPTAGVLTSCTGLPISTGVSGLGTGVATFLATPSSANLLSAVTGSTGTGALVFGTTPTIATPVLNGTPTGTGVASAATASTLALRDSNANIFYNNLIEGYTTTATAAGTTTLTVSSTYLQIFTGSTTQTVTLPVTSTLTLGFAFYIQNNSTGNVTIQSSGANAIVVIPGGVSVIMTCILTSGTTAASWTYTALHQAGQVLGTATNDNANAGNIGELQIANILQGSAVSLTSGTAQNVTSIVLTPGDWDITCMGFFTGGATTTSTGLRTSVSTTSNTENTTAPGFASMSFNSGTTPFSTFDFTLPSFTIRESLTAATTTFFMVSRAQFAVSTCSGYGYIRARRIR